MFCKQLRLRCFQFVSRVVRYGSRDSRCGTTSQLGIFVGMAINGNSRVVHYLLCNRADERLM